jgi:SNF2 family DNA or RNA helicase
MKIETVERVPAWTHQAAEFCDYWDAPARALLWQMRTGKSKTIIDTLCAWYRHRELRSAIIIAPNGVHENWVRRELPKHAWIDYCAHAWTSRRARTKVHRGAVESLMITDQLSILAIGKESLLSRAVQKTVKRLLRRGPCALIVDESHHFGRPGARRTRLARGLAKRCAMRRILSGTATGNSPLRLFSQFELLNPGALGFSRFTGPSGFEARYAVLGEGYDPRSGRRYKRIDGYEHLDELQERVARWSSIVLREDCEDLPELVFSRQYYEPSPRQRQVYEQLRQSYMAELQSGELIEAADSGVRLLRLQQVLSNFVLTDTYEISTVDPSADPRLDALVGLIDGPSVIWCRFVEDIRRVTARLRAESFSVVQYYGAVREDDRIRAQDRFASGEATIFVGQPGCAGEGLDLSAADAIIWFSHVFDVVMRDQATERATEVGGERVSVVDLVVADSVDEYILANLENKRSVADRVTGRELRDILERCMI